MIVTDPFFLSRPVTLMAQLDCMETQNLSNDLLATAYHLQGKCIGLAANQVGGEHRLVVVRGANAPAVTFRVLANPVIISAKGVKAWKETCLSFPGRAPTKTRRNKFIKVQHLDMVTGEDVITKFQGLAAAAVQHEIDHLNGVLI